jgi:hypothetical protein
MTRAHIVEMLRDAASMIVLAAEAGRELCPEDAEEFEGDDTFAAELRTAADDLDKGEEIE